MTMTKHFIQEGIIRSEIENFLRNELDSAGYSGINIQKTLLSTRVTLYVEKPPLVIGKRGKRIDKLTTVLKEKYKIENPSIDVQKVENPTLDPNIVARRIVSALERGMNRRRVVYKAIRAIMGSGAKGVEVVLSGKIIGKGGRARVEKYSEGYMKKAGDSAKLVKTGAKQAYLKAGIIGVKAMIVPPDTRFPDRFEVGDVKAAKQEPEKEAASADAKKAEAPEKKKPEDKKKTESRVKRKSKPKPKIESRNAGKSLEGGTKSPEGNVKALQGEKDKKSKKEKEEPKSEQAAKKKKAKEDASGK